MKLMRAVLILCTVAVLGCAAQPGGSRGPVPAGADAVALDCTRRGRESGALERVKRLRLETDAIVVADIATVPEAVQAVEAGAQIILSTMRGYTDDTGHLTVFEPEFIARLVQATGAPVIAEGRIRSPEEACAALQAGAVAVVVGTAITNPEAISRWFTDAMGKTAVETRSGHVIAVDMGGTFTKSGIVTPVGELHAESVQPTPPGGRDALLDNLKRAVRSRIADAERAGLAASAIGVATAGWVDANTGRIVYATENLPGWTGTSVAETLRSEFGLPAFIENDANAVAHAERVFGAAKAVDDFVCITLGTGVGGGCYVNGALMRGANSFANAIGHICVEPGGRACTCGQSGCLEAYANAAALVRQANDAHLQSAEEVIRAAASGHAGAVQSIKECAERLAAGCATLIHLLDPRLLIFSGGLVRDNSMLLSELQAALPRKVMAWERRQVEVVCSRLGYHTGVLGAAALALLPGRPGAGVLTGSPFVQSCLDIYSN